jgi:hypothetical protein
MGHLRFVEHAADQMPLLAPVEPEGFDPFEARGQRFAMLEDGLSSHLYRGDHELIDA